MNQYLQNKNSFKNRVLNWAVKLEVKVNTISIRPMKKKWASCSTSGNLSFNTELLLFADEVTDYVIVHELLHFSIPNHGKLWKSLMRAYLGDYETMEEILRRNNPDRHQNMYSD